MSTKMLKKNGKEKRPFGYLKEPQNLIHDFKERAKEGKPLNPDALDKDDPTLYLAILKEFDSFDDFLLEAGFDPTEIRKQQRWSFDKIKRKLDDMYSNDIPLKYKSKKKQNDIYRNIIRPLVHYFGNIEKGLNNFNYTRLSNGYLARLCTRCKKNILDKNEKGLVCEECK